MWRNPARTQAALYWNRKRRKARMTSWTPEEYSPLAWWDFNDTDTIYTDTAGTTLVTADGQSIARVNDKSGNSKNLTQTTAGNRPLYKTDGTLSWALLDGTDDVLLAASAVTAREIFVMADGPQGDNIPLMGHTTDYPFAPLPAAGNKLIDTGFADAGITAGTSAKNGTVYANVSLLPYWSSGMNIFHVGATADFTVNRVIEDRTGLTRAFSGKIREVLFFGTLTADERRKVEGYLAHKWGATSLLPSDHAYKTEAPR